MIGSATSNQVNPAAVARRRADRIQFGQRETIVLHPALEDLPQHLGLLVDLLVHIVSVTIATYTSVLAIAVDRAAFHRAAIQAFNFDAVGSQGGEVAVPQLECLGHSRTQRNCV